MPDRHFLALSGAIANTTAHSKTGVPCLGSLPVLGLAFSRNANQFSTGNVIIFIQPHIIHNFEEWDEISKRQEDVYRDDTRYKEDYDRGLELIVKPDDM